MSKKILKKVASKEKVEPLKPGQKAGVPETMAATYNCSLGHLANMRSRKKGPKFYKQGRRVFYKVNDFEAWLFSNPVMTTDAHEEKVLRG